jgi:hypothetical protein
VRQATDQMLKADAEVVTLGRSMSARIEQLEKR